MFAYCNVCTSLLPAPVLVLMPISERAKPKEPGREEKRRDVAARPRRLIQVYARIKFLYWVSRGRMLAGA